jgi:hypothetical protein
MTSHTNNKEYMREYMRKRRAAGLDRSRLPKGVIGPEAPDWEGLHRSPNARERSAYLDSLILGKKLDQETEPPLTAGDLHRASLPVGYKGSTIIQREGDAQRAAELIPLVEAVEAIYSDLPDLVTAKDVADKLDPALIERVKNRWFLAITARLKKLGAVSRDAGNTADGTRVRLYIVRGAEGFAGVKGRKLYAAYKALKIGTGSSAPTVTVQRPSARRPVRQRAPAPANAGLGLRQKTRQSHRTKNNRPPRRQSLRREAPAATGAAQCSSRSSRIRDYF